MKVGDLVMKRSGKVFPYERKPGIFMGMYSYVSGTPFLTCDMGMVQWPGQPIRYYRVDELKVLSESR